MPDINTSALCWCLPPCHTPHCLSVTLLAFCMHNMHTVFKSIRESDVSSQPSLFECCIAEHQVSIRLAAIESTPLAPPTSLWRYPSSLYQPWHRALAPRALLVWPLAAKPRGRAGGPHGHPQGAGKTFGMKTNPSSTSYLSHPHIGMGLTAYIAAQ